VSTTTVGGEGEGEEDSDEWMGSDEEEEEDEEGEEEEEAQYGQGFPGAGGDATGKKPATPRQHFKCSQCNKIFYGPLKFKSELIVMFIFLFVQDVKLDLLLNI